MGVRMYTGVCRGPVSCSTTWVLEMELRVCFDSRDLYPLSHLAAHLLVSPDWP